MNLKLNAGSLPRWVLLMTALCAGVSAQGPAVPAVIPRPVSLATQAGQFSLNARTKIVVSDDLLPLGEQLRSYLAPATGLPLEVTTRGDNNNVIRLSLNKGLSQLGSEGYQLDASPEAIEIRAAELAGIFYGIQTLRQLLPTAIFRRAKAENVSWTVPGVKIEDTPRFPWRGAHMDVSRHFMRKEFVLRFLDLMALHKLNVFHWHLVDDDGWRIQIQRYPKLTETASQMDYSSINPEKASRSASVQPGGYYTQDDIREVVAYAAARYITVVPEIEIPGHSNAAVHAYPELGNLVQIQAAGADTKFLNPFDNEHYGPFDNIYNVDDSTVDFLKNVLTEVLGLFPSKFIHIGGDEVDKRPWQHNPVAQAKMKQLGLKNEEELQSWMVKQFDDFLTAHGRRLIGWDEILEGGLAPGATVMSWRGTSGGIAAANAGHDVVMTPEDTTYFDHYQGLEIKSQPKAIGGYTPLQTTYEYEPTAGMDATASKRVLGTQGQIWTEFVPDPRYLEYMVFPRLCALSEVAWSPQSTRNFADFTRRLPAHLDRLTALDVHFFPVAVPPQPIAHWSPKEVTSTPQNHEWDITSAINGPGAYTIIFMQGPGGVMNINWVEIDEDGKPLARIEHLGSTDTHFRSNDYDFSLAAVKPGAHYSLRANTYLVWNDNPTGDVYLLKK